MLTKPKKTFCRADLAHAPFRAENLKVSATLKIAIFPYSRSQRFQIDMLERKYYFCRKISGVKDFLSLIILIDR